MTPEQRAALLVLREQIADAIDGTSARDKELSRWSELCDLALGEVIDPWAMFFHAPSIKEQMGKV